MLSPASQFRCQRLKNFTVPLLIRIVPKSVITVSIVHPAGMIQDRIETNALHRHTVGNGPIGLLTKIAQPARSLIVLGPSFGNKNRPMITLINFGQHFNQWPVQRMRLLERSESANATKAF